MANVLKYLGTSMDIRAVSSRAASRNDLIPPEICWGAPEGAALAMTTSYAISSRTLWTILAGENQQLEQTNQPND